MTDKHITMDGSYRTRNGIAVTIRCIADPDSTNYPVMATLQDGTDAALLYTIHGKYYIDGIHKLDLVSQEEEPTTTVPHSPHYNGTEVLDLIESYGLGFNLGNAIKYVARAGRKGERASDLQKALFYIQRELDNAK